MSGLYHKALKYFQTQQQLRIVKPEELTEEEALDVSPDDREKILTQINEIVDKNRIEIKPDTFDFKPKKRGGTLPLLFNLAAIVIIAAGGYFLLNYFDRSEASIVTTRSGLQSAEGKLLAALKEESEKRLSEKEQAIADIQNRLSEMNAERVQLEAEAEARIQEREAELETAMMEQLANERARLQSEGLSETDITERLKSFETEQQARFEERLATARAEAEAEIDRQRETLNQLTTEYESALTAAEQEKSLLEDELTQQEATLLAEFQKKEAALESERLDALQELESLRTQREREQLALDQILSFYGAVQAHLSAGDFDDALASLTDLEAYLNQSNIISLEGVRNRRQVEMFLVGSLKTLVAEQQRAESPDTQSLINSAQMLASATALIEQGNELYINADYSNAKELYLSALSGIPAIGLGFQRLREIEKSETDEETAIISEITERADQAYLSGDFSGAVALYGEALDRISPLAGAADTITSNLAAAGYQLNREEDLSTIQELQELVERQSAELEMLAALRAELTGELNTLNEQASADAAQIAGIPPLQDQINTLESQAAENKKQIERIPGLETKITVLESQLETRENANQEQRDRIEFLNSEINRLTKKTEDNARELLSLNSYKTQAENERSARDELIEDLNRLKNSYIERNASVVPSEDPLTVLELLETKLALRRIASTEPIKSDYPDLYQNLENYLDTLVAESRSEARLSTLISINDMLDSVLPQSTGMPADYDALLENPSEKDVFLAFIDRIVALLK